MSVFIHMHGMKLVRNPLIFDIITKLTSVVCSVLTRACDFQALTNMLPGAILQISL